MTFYLNTQMLRKITEPSTSQSARTGLCGEAGSGPLSVECLLSSAVRASCPVRGWEGDGAMHRL